MREKLWRTRMPKMPRANMWALLAFRLQLPCPELDIHADSMVYIKCDSVNCEQASASCPPKKREKKLCFSCTSYRALRQKCSNAETLVARWQVWILCTQSSRCSTALAQYQCCLSSGPAECGISWRTLPIFDTSLLLSNDP